MKRALSFALLAFALGLGGGLLWLGWELHPWVPAGRPLHVSDHVVGAFEFQVWQRKNDSLWEPFTTGLFVRKSGMPWHVFLVDIQDGYHPSMRLQEDGPGIAVLDGAHKLGVFNPASMTFQWRSTPRRDAAAVLDGDPPGNWGAKP